MGCIPVKYTSIFTSLNGVSDALCPIGLPGSLTDQVTHLVRGVVRKDKSMASVWGILSFFSSIFLQQLKGNLSLWALRMFLWLNVWLIVWTPALGRICSILKTPCRKWRISIMLCVSQGSRSAHIKCLKMGRSSLCRGNPIAPPYFMCTVCKVFL